jgi:hypothetical protein
LLDRLEKLTNNKLSSLFRKSVIYGQKFLIAMGKAPKTCQLLEPVNAFASLSFKIFLNIPITLDFLELKNMLFC